MNLKYFSIKSINLYLNIYFTNNYVNRNVLLIIFLFLYQDGVYTASLAKWSVKTLRLASSVIYYPLSTLTLLLVTEGLTLLFKYRSLPCPCQV